MEPRMECQVLMCHVLTLPLETFPMSRLYLMGSNPACTTPLKGRVRPSPRAT